jgi:hypothetical protein
VTRLYGQAPQVTAAAEALEAVTAGGAVTRRRGPPGEDYGFRLWDPKHRRADPLPAPPGDDQP